MHLLQFKYLITSMYYRILIFLTLLCFLNTSCNFKNDIKLLSAFKPVDSFVIKYNFKEKAVNASYSSINYPYFYFLSENADKICIINLKSKQFISIGIDSFLIANRIGQINNIHVINNDSILLLPFNDNKIFLIDSNCKLIRTYIIDKKSSHDYYANTYSNPVYTKGDLIILGYQNTRYNNYFGDSIHHKYFFNEKVSSIQKINKNSNLAEISKIGDFPSCFKSNNFYDWYINSTLRNNIIAYAFSNVDTIYEFDINSSKLINKHPINNLVYDKNKDVNPNNLNTYNKIREFYIENSFYNDLVYDHFRNRYLLFYSHKTEYLKNKFENAAYDDKIKYVIAKQINNSSSLYIQVDKDYIIETMAYNEKGIIFAKKIKNGLKFYIFNL